MVGGGEAAAVVAAGEEDEEDDLDDIEAAPGEEAVANFSMTVAEVEENLAGMSR